MLKAAVIKRNCRGERRKMAAYVNNKFLSKWFFGNDIVKQQNISAFKYLCLDVSNGRVLQTKLLPFTLSIYIYIYIYAFFHGATAPSGPGHHYQSFTITLRHITLGRTPLDEWSARRKDLHPDNTKPSQEAAIYVSGRIRTYSHKKPEHPQTHVLDRVVIGVSRNIIHIMLKILEVILELICQLLACIAGYILSAVGVHCGLHTVSCWRALRVTYDKCAKIGIGYTRDNMASDLDSRARVNNFNMSGHIRLPRFPRLGAIMIDFSKAFDLVSHDQLLKKLQPRAWIQGWSYGLGNF
jgi:hypothetical protein